MMSTDNGKLSRGKDGVRRGRPGEISFHRNGFLVPLYLTDIAGLPAAAAIRHPDREILGRSKSIPSWVLFPTGRERASPPPAVLPVRIGSAVPVHGWFSAPLRNRTGGVLRAALVLCLLNTAYTVVNIPYGSLTPNSPKIITSGIR